ncbi:hypothetical protein QMK47_19505 [Pseudomonas sp. P9_35]|uniref:hypothetical protein n=1 Tax=unclassified Pseudomonas TaxID=196821 RepID=UPI002A35F686|nr:MULTISPECIES: hypothetical protein [unclassified Pseudomonas]WPN61725.1 hypothetical protein QMK48_18605 [Pseudomonas sp. P9_32]WPN67480.1 hypothetical protein QMK47_19505 [Pseudomonas sp. P9_35]
MALIAYVVEHGDLPTWISSALSGLSSFLRAEVPWAFWEILIAFLTPCAILGALIVMLLRKNSVDVDDYNTQNDMLIATDAAKNQLEKQHKKLTSDHAKLLTSVEALTLSNSDLVAQNEELKKEAAGIAISTESKNINIDRTSLSVLNAIATLTERDVKVELDNIESLVRIGKIQSHASLDVLTRSWIGFRVWQCPGNMLSPYC